MRIRDLEVGIRQIIGAWICKSDRPAGRIEIRGDRVGYNRGNRANRKIGDRSKPRIIPQASSDVCRTSEVERYAAVEYVAVLIYKERNCSARPIVNKRITSADRRLSFAEDRSQQPGRE